MNDLAVFTNEQFGEIRTVTEGNKIYFCGSDVAKALGYSNPRDALSRHCKSKGVVKHDTLTKGGIQELTYIDEGNVYRLITHSKLPDAENFESWIFDEVLPTIRKTGSYSLTVKQDSYLIEDPIARAERWIEEQKEKRLLETKVVEQEKEIEYKEDVIIGLVDNISLADKRQILNRVVRYKHANYQERWSLLYREFENKYHLDLSRRVDTYNETHKPKCKTKLEYIDRVMNKIPELYELAAKLFENDVKELVQEMYGTV